MKKMIPAFVMALLLLTGCASGKADPETATRSAHAATEPAPFQIKTAPVHTEPNAIPTTAPTEASVPSAMAFVPPAPPPPAEPIVITKHPTSEIVAEGGKT